MVAADGAACVAVPVAVGLASGAAVVVAGLVEPGALVAGCVVPVVRVGVVRGVESWSGVGVEVAPQRHPTESCQW